MGLIVYKLPTPVVSLLHKKEGEITEYNNNFVMLIE